MKPSRLILAAFAAVACLAAPLAHAQKTLKYAHFQPAKDDQPKHAAALAFKDHVEKATGGSVKVEIYPAGQFGKDQPTMEGVKLGAQLVVLLLLTLVPGFSTWLPHAFGYLK